MPVKATVTSKENAAATASITQKAIENHKTAAMHHESAAKNHHEAAKHLGDGDEYKASASAIKALRDHFNAGEYQREDAKHHAHVSKTI